MLGVKNLKGQVIIWCFRQQEKVCSVCQLADGSNLYNSNIIIY